MDKQPFDHIENRIRQAADEASFPFSDEAWKRMEIKLDNEFNKERRRRGFIWWWFSLIFVGLAALGIYVYNSKFGNSPEKNISTGSSSNATEKKLAATTNAKKQAGFTENSKPVGGISSPDIEDGKTSQAPNTILKEPVSDKTQTFVETTQGQQTDNKNFVTGKIGTNKQKHNQGSASKSVISAPALTTFNNTGKKSKAGEIAFVQHRNSSDNNSKRIDLAQHKSGAAINSQIVDSSALGSPPNGNSKTIAGSSPDEKVSIEKDITKDSAIATASPDSAKKATASVKLTPKPSKGLYFLASVAGDVTTIKDLALKEAKPVFGFGVGYRFNNRFSLQTGFYFGKKVYTAGPDDYKVKPGSYIAKIISADAECYIYDVPVTLRYDVLHKNHFNFYATTGLSSLFLKRETYDIHFFNPSGTYRRMAYTYTSNVNYLSVLNFSLGYEQKLSRSLYIQAEPYLKLPIAGVGEGSVKLYSAGLQIGVKYQPFSKKK